MDSTAQLNCHVCGRFIGNAGDPDIAYIMDEGCYEVGYPTCPKHKARWKMSAEELVAQEAADAYKGY